MKFIDKYGNIVGARTKNGKPPAMIIGFQLKIIGVEKTIRQLKLLSKKMDDFINGNGDNDLDYFETNFRK